MRYLLPAMAILLASCSTSTVKTVKTEVPMPVARSIASYSKFKVGDVVALRSETSVEKGFIKITDIWETWTKGEQVNISYVDQLGNQGKLSGEYLDHLLQKIETKSEGCFHDTFYIDKDVCIGDIFSAYKPGTTLNALEFYRDMVVVGLPQSRDPYEGYLMMSKDKKRYVITHNPVITQEHSCQKDGPCIGDKFKTVTGMEDKVVGIPYSVQYVGQVIVKFGEGEHYGLLTPEQIESRKKMTKVFSDSIDKVEISGFPLLTSDKEAYTKLKERLSNKAAVSCDVVSFFMHSYDVKNSDPVSELDGKCTKKWINYGIRGGYWEWTCENLKWNYTCKNKYLN